MGMQLKNLLQSKLAHRISLLFFACALIPVVTLSIIAHSHVVEQLTEQSRERLHRTSKRIAVGIAGRLSTLDAHLGEVSARIDSSPDPAAFVAQAHHPGLLGVRLVAANPSSDSDTTGAAAADFEGDQLRHLDLGRTLLVVDFSRNGSASVLLARAVSLSDAEGPILLAEVDPTFLWAETHEEEFAPQTNLSILHEEWGDIHSTFSTERAPRWHRRPEWAPDMGMFEWRREGEAFLSYVWGIPLKYRYGTDLYVILTEPRGAVLAPIRSFQRAFVLLVLLTIVTALLASSILIRKSLQPLTELRMGTHKIAAGAFSSRVQVQGGDEFQELATSFNEMAERLGRQFGTLQTINELGQSVLSTLDLDELLRITLKHVPPVYSATSLQIVVANTDSPNSFTSFSVFPDTDRDWTRRALTMSEADVAQLLLCPMEGLLIAGDEKVPTYLQGIARPGRQWFIVLPMQIRNASGSHLALGFDLSVERGPEFVSHARHLADQLAVALQNIQLFEELGDLSWGSILALARTVDAKSPWTAGHSERVARETVRIGRALGLDREELDILHRGALLHDIGKIGVSAEILNKPTTLTKEEFEALKEHVHIGARIIEPITSFSALRPIVLYHHERFDGSGYPEGRAGEDIPFHARIVCVADSFDAMISERPYRAALDRELVLNTIREQAGRQFDPVIAKTFLRIQGLEKDTDREHRVETRS